MTKLTAKQKKMLEELDKGTYKSDFEKRMDKRDANLRKQQAQSKEKYIAPIKTTAKSEEKEHWTKRILKTPDAFKDNKGNFFTDTISTVGSTVADVGLNILKAPIDIGVNAGKLLSSGVAQVADWVGQDEYADKVRNRLAGKEDLAFGVEKNPFEEYPQKAIDKANEDSVLGDFGQKIPYTLGYISALASGGKLLGKAGNIPIGKLQMPTLALVSGAGGAVTETYQKEDTNDFQDWANIAGSGLIEGITEGLFGVFGVGGSGIDDVLTKGASELAKTGLGKAMAQLGVKSFGEGAEEILSHTGNYVLGHGIDFVSDILGYEGKDEFGEEFNSDEMWESFWLAVITTGIGEGGSTATQTVTTSSERIAQIEQETGKKLNAQEKAEIRKQTLEDIVLANEQRIAEEMQEGQEVAPVQDAKIEENAPNTEQDAPVQVNEQVTEQVSEQVAPDPQAKQAETEAYIEQKVEELKQAEDPRVQEIIRDEIEVAQEELPRTDLTQKPEAIDPKMAEAQSFEGSKALTEENMPPVKEDTTPDVEDTESVEKPKPISPFADRDITEVSKKGVKAYMDENPDVKPYFQEEAQNMLHDLDNTIKGEKIVTKVYNPYTGLYENAEYTGTKRQTTEAIEYLRDNTKATYAQIRKALEDIVNDAPKKNALVKKIEFLLDERMREGYKTSDGFDIPINDKYVKFLEEQEFNKQATENAEAITDKDATLDDSTYLTIAPYTNTNVTSKNFDEVKNAVEEKFIGEAKKISAMFNIEIENISTNMGGFTFQEGDLAGKSVKEVSYTFEIKTENIEDADLIASLMGDLAHEQQEAVISANYLDANSTDANAIEFRVGFKKERGVLTALKKAGISDYTIDKTNNTIKILEFDLDNSSIEETLEKLVTELGGNYNGSEKSKIESRYLDTEGRRSLYENWLATTEINEQNRELSSYVEQALQKLGGKTDSTSKINENGEINDEATADDKDVAPIEKEAENANTEEIDALVNKEIDTSFMREETKKKLENYFKERQQLNVDRKQSYRDFDTQIRQKRAEYEGLQNKNTKKANNLLQQIARLETRKENVQDEYIRRIANVTNRIDNMKTEDFVKKEKKATQKELRRKEFEKTGITEKALNTAKNISKFFMNNTDTIRLQEMVFGREVGRKINETIFQPVKDSTSNKIRFQKKERAEIKALGIKARSKESEAVQKYGEKQYVDENGKVHKYGDAELQAEFPDAEVQKKIKEASRVIRQKYDTYIDMANAVITKYGYDPIPKRKDYMRHFQELNDLFSRSGLPFNMQSAQAYDLPTDINGATADLKPGKTFFASTLQRKGNKTTYDAITGIDGYIEGIGNLIYHTDNIQKLRAFEEYIREIYGENHGFDNFDNLTEDEQAIQLQKIQDHHLGGYVAWLREYTNNLAGKQSMVDRAVESLFGRRAYSFLNELKSQVGSNMTGLNLGSALTNPISMTQALAKTSKLATAKGYADTIKNIFVQDNFIEQNNFLTSRFGSDILSPTFWQKMRNAGQVFMSATDWFASNAITRSKFYELKAQGLSDAEAHAQAGDFASRILGDRSQGATPLLYNSKILGLVTQFQLEVNNQMYSMFGDTIADAKEASKKEGALKSSMRATFVLGQLAMYQWTFNNFYESLTGRRPAFDIISALATALGAGEGDDEEEKPLGDRLYDAMDILMDGIPYVNIITGGGRIPISDALPIEELWSGKDEFGNDKSRLKTLGEALPYYFLPTGYSQLKKSTSGLGMYDSDLPVAGSYTDSGNLRFTVDDDPMTVLQSAIFGQWSSESAKDYINSDFETIDKNNIEELVEAGFNSTDYVKYKKGLNEIKKMELEDGESRVTYIHDYINDLDVTDEQKNVLYKHASSDKEQEKFEELDMSLDQIGSYFEAKATISQQVAQYLNSKDSLTLDDESDQYKEIVSDLSNDKKGVIIDAVMKTNLTDEQKKYLYGKYYSSEKTMDKILEKGTSMDTYLQFEKDTLGFEADKDEDGDTISGSKGNKYEEYLLNSDMSNEDKTNLYEYSVLSNFDDDKKHTTYKALKQAGVDINNYLSYASQTFTADKDENGKTISGSRREKVYKYINSLKLSIPQKAMLMRSEYSTYTRYNKEIVRYVNSLNLTKAEKTAILEEFDFTVEAKRVTWK